MLDTEQTSLGLYLPDATDPDTSQPLAAALWEVALLHRHYHPTVAKLARRVAAGTAAALGRRRTRKRPGGIGSTGRDGTLQPRRSLRGGVRCSVGARDRAHALARVSACTR